MKTTLQMNQVNFIVGAVLIAFITYNHAANLTPGNILATGSEIFEVPTVNGSCVSNGTLFELTFEGQIVQQIDVPAECLFFGKTYAGYITLSKDAQSAVLPCCFESNPDIGFVQIFFNGTTSAMKTIQIPSNATEPHNIILDGDDLWFVGRNYDLETDGFAQLLYANTQSGETAVLYEDDLFFVDIANNELLVSNFYNLPDGLFQVGSGLPKTEDQPLSGLLNLSNVLDGFIHNDKYAYYAQYAPERQLVRCDPNTWEPLYALNVTGELVHFAVSYKNDSDVTIVGTMLTELYYVVATFHDNGKEISLVSTTNTSDYVVKIGSLVPISHCVNGKMDFDETDVDCGGSLCDTCQVGKKCSSNTDCASNYCDGTSSTCAVQPVPTAQGPTSTNTPKSKTSDGSTLTMAFGAVTAVLMLSQ